MEEPFDKFTFYLNTKDVKKAEIQEVGSYQTYTTRYLYIQLLNLVESDQIDMNLGRNKKEQKTPSPKKKERVSDKRLLEIQELIGNNVFNSNKDVKNKDNLRKETQRLLKNKVITLPEYHRVLQSINKIHCK